MIVDVHSHAWRYPDDFTETFREEARRARAGVEVDLSTTLEDYRRNAPSDTKTIVFGGKARLSGIWVSDEIIAQYVAQDPERLIGFLSVDPTQPGWLEELRDGHERLGLRGVKLMPMYAGFMPDDPEIAPFWEYVDRHALPVLLHTGTTFISKAPLTCTLPRRLDAVAIRHPNVRIIMAHLGHPYEAECVAVIRKHEHVYADVSALYYRPFQLFHSLMLVQEYGVWPKLLFGTDYPFTTVESTLQGLRTLNETVAQNWKLKLDEAQIEGLIQRDSLPLLGLA